MKLSCWSNGYRYVGHLGFEAVWTSRKVQMQRHVDLVEWPIEQLSPAETMPGQLASGEENSVTPFSTRSNTIGVISDTSDDCAREYVVMRLWFSVVADCCCDENVQCT